MLILKKLIFLENILQQGMSLNIASLGGQALVGISINALLFIYSDIATVGIFNVLYAIYAVAGQLVAFGIPEAILNRFRTKDLRAEHYSSLWCALVCSLFISIPLSYLFFSSTKLSQFSTSFPELANGIVLLSLALPFFCLNKILVAVFNSYSRFVLMASLPLIRAVLILTSAIGVLYSDGTIASNLGYVFIIPEIIVFSVFFPFISRSITIPVWKDFFAASKYFITFGLGVCGYSVLTELFFRIDVITISVLFPKEQVGIYTIAALFLEGVIQVLFIFRQVSIPRFRSKLDVCNLNDLANFIQNQALSGLIIAVTLSFLVCLGFYLVSIYGFSINDENFPVLLGLLLLAGVTYSGVSPIENLSYLTNAPVQQTAYLLIGSLATVISIIVLHPLGDIRMIPLAVIIGFLFSGLFWYCVIWRNFCERLRNK